MAFIPFVVIGPRRFFDLFSLKLSTGREIERKRAGVALKQERRDALVRIPLTPLSYLESERKVADLLNKLTGARDGT